MSLPLSAIEFIEINPPSSEEDESVWLEKQVILAQGKAVKLSAGLNLKLAAKLLRSVDAICPQLAWEINKTETLLIFNHSTEDWLWPSNLILPSKVSFLKTKKQIPQLELDLAGVWKQTNGNFLQRLNSALDLVKSELKSVFLVTLNASEEEKYFALLLMHNFLHKTKAGRLVSREENLKIW